MVRLVLNPECEKVKDICNHFYLRDDLKLLLKSVVFNNGSLNVLSNSVFATMKPSHLRAIVYVLNGLTKESFFTTHPRHGNRKLYPLSDKQFNQLLTSIAMATGYSFIQNRSGYTWFSVPVIEKSIDFQRVFRLNNYEAWRYLEYVYDDRFIEYYLKALKRYLLDKYTYTEDKVNDIIEKRYHEIISPFNLLRDRNWRNYFKCIAVN